MDALVGLFRHPGFVAGGCQISDWSGGWGFKKGEEPCVKDGGRGLRGVEATQELVAGEAVREGRAICYLPQGTPESQKASRPGEKYVNS